MEKARKRVADVIGATAIFFTSGGRRATTGRSRARCAPTRKGASLIISAIEHRHLHSRRSNARL
ncbi:MAG: hypothetical protein ACLUI3_10695 [Christensenellales bacterium]